MHCCCCRYMHPLQLQCAQAELRLLVFPGTQVSSRVYVTSPRCVCTDYVWGVVLLADLCVDTSHTTLLYSAQACDSVPYRYDLTYPPVHLLLPRCCTATCQASRGSRSTRSMAARPCCSRHTLTPCLRQSLSTSDRKSWSLLMMRLHMALCCLGTRRHQSSKRL